ncbi:hypothetical protein [Variovorax sp. dw_308]|uniref:hypothetical protein n=1 Tax=Variovorax sp. dw_308 TaxID=2721546 RepID=UPI001C47B119|nr:hypothetical protein [Variovorax sp. dw_308]
MPAAHSRLTRPPRHLAWLLWLVLLLPVAQVAATSHLLSHAGEALAAAADQKAATHVLQCDLCATAGAIAGGALAASPPSLALPPAAPVETPRPAFDNLRENLLALAYQGRAPPDA